MLRDSDGDTPLHACENAESAAALLEAGALIDAKNLEGKTPYEVAFEEFREDMVRFLQGEYLARGLELPVAVREADAEEGEGAADNEEEST